MRGDENRHRYFGNPTPTGTLSADEILRQLVADQETVARTARSVFPAADEANDEPTADLLTQRMQIHEKNAWMPRGLLE